MEKTEVYINLLKDIQKEAEKMCSIWNGKSTEDIALVATDIDQTCDELISLLIEINRYV